MIGEHDDSRYPTSWRERWEFTYKAAAVAEAAQQMVDHHEKRTAWWESEAKGAEEELKEKGFEYRDRMGSRGRGNVEIVGDPELAKRVAHCKDKVEEHEKMQKTYSSWVRALTAAAEQDESRELTVTISDVLFFQL